MSKPIETHSALLHRSRSIRSAFVVVFSGPMKPGTRKKVIPEMSLGREDVLMKLGRYFDAGHGPAMIHLPKKK